VNWSQNWGGTDFPRLKTQWDGLNIPVAEAGNYHVVLNFSEKPL